MQGLVFEFATQQEVVSRSLIQSKELDQILQQAIYWKVDWHKHQPYIVFVGQRKEQADSQLAASKKQDSIDGLEHEFKFKNTFGERLDDFHSPEIFLFDYETSRLHLLEHDFQNLNPSIVIFAQNPKNLDLYMQAFAEEPFRRGIMYCFNRESSIYSLDVALPSSQISAPETTSDPAKETPKISVQKMENLTPDFFCSYSPFLSPSNDILFFLASPQKFIQHNANFELFCLPVQPGTPKPVKLISKIAKPNPKFVGLDDNIFQDSQRYFLFNGKYLLFSAILCNTMNLFLFKTPIDLDQPISGEFQF